MSKMPFIDFKSFNTVNKRRIMIISNNSARFINESGLISNLQLTVLGFEIVITVLAKYPTVIITIKDRS